MLPAAMTHPAPRRSPDRRPRRGPRDPRAGFGLVEVAMATFVMALGISTAIIALQMDFKALNLARDSTLASQIMQSEIERLRLMPWANSSAAVDSITELPASETVSLESMFSANAQLTQRFQVVRAVAMDPDRPDVRRITLTVRWTSFDGRSHTRSFTTLYCKNGLYDYYYTLAG